MVSSDQHWSFYLDNWGKTIAFLLLVLAVGVIGLALYLAMTVIRRAIRQRRIRRDVRDNIRRHEIQRLMRLGLGTNCACIGTRTCTRHRNMVETMRRMSA